MYMTKVSFILIVGSTYDLKWVYQPSLPHNSRHAFNCPIINDPHVLIGQINFNNWNGHSIILILWYLHKSLYSASVTGESKFYMRLFPGKLLCGGSGGWGGGCLVWVKGCFGRLVVWQNRQYIRPTYGTCTPKEYGWNHIYMTIQRDQQHCVNISHLEKPFLIWLWWEFSHRNLGVWNLHNFLDL